MAGFLKMAPMGKRLGRTHVITPLLHWILILLTAYFLYSPRLYATVSATPVSVDSLVKVTLNKQSVGTLDVYSAQIKNISQQVIKAPVSLVITDISNSKVKLLYPLGYTATGQPYVKVPLLTGVLKPGHAALTLLTFNKSKKSDTYTFKTNVLGVLAGTNLPPVANAGPDQSAALGATVTLNGAGSSDPNRDLITYSWSIVSKPTGSLASLSDPTLVNPTFVLDKPGTYTIQLVANDGRLSSAADTVLVSTLNSPPVANAGSNQTVVVSKTVQLDGSGSTDADGNALTYAWTLTIKPDGSTATLINPNSVNPSFMSDKAGIYVAKLVVNDGKVNSDPATVTITTENSPPVAHAGPDQTILVTQVVHLDGTGSSDVDGDALNYEWTLSSRPSGSTATLSSTTDPKPSFTADKPGSYVVQLIVNDGQVNSAMDSVTISTQNSAPVANAGLDQTGVVNQLITLDGSASSDVDGNPLTYDWSLISKPTGSSAGLTNPTTVNPSFTLDKFGPYVAQLVVNDGSLNSLADTVTLTMLNSPPVAHAGPNQTVYVGQTVHLNGSGSTDVDGNALTYQWSLTAPAGSNAQLSDASLYNPTFEVDRPGTYAAQLIVNDGTVTSDPATVTITTQNSPPVANAGQDQTVFTGSTVKLLGSASHDVDGDPLTYQWSLISKPDKSQTGLQNETAVDPSFSVDQPGTYVVQLIVNDGTVNSDPAQVTITTQNSRPFANAGANQTGYIGQTLHLDGSLSSDADHDPLTYSWSLLTQPATSTATLSGADSVSPSLSPDAIGDYIAQLIVRDGQLDSAPATTVLSILNRAPSITNTNTVLSAIEGVPFSVTILANDPDGQALTYRLTVAPAGMEIDQTTGVVNWPVPTVGTSPFTVQVVDTLGASASLSFTVNTSAALFPVPDLTGQTQAQATATLTQWHLLLGNVTTDYSNTIPAGSVIGQTPIPGFLVTTGTLVDLLVSKGPNPASIAVPDVVGQGKNAAMAALLSAQLKVGTITESYSDTVPAVPAGKVISQNPLAGSYVAVGSTVDFTVSLGPQGGGGSPADPADVAPPVDPTVATTTYASTEFLYTGTNPIQTGVAAGTINPVRAAVIRGRVLTRDNQPLSGVTISIHNHAEFGQTLSRTDGMFDMAVNGGGYLTVNYQKTDYLPAQRPVNVPWQNYAQADDVVLIQQDNNVTAVDMSGSTTSFQVARGGVVNDQDGTRQATLLIPPGTQAQVYNTDGTTRPVSSLNLRLTEYTVGSNGPQSMPAPLPPTSAYTYAVEIKGADVKIGGKDVLFDRPVPVYVENFLNFPVGMDVPVGYYDSGKGAWIPYPDGRIVKVLAENNGLANLDIDGSGQPATAQALAGLGITDAERQQLATLYAPGQSFWRVAVTHLSTWDCNMPSGLPPDSRNPDQRAAQQDTPKDETCQKTQARGSVIECENQTLQESLPVNGTPFGLNYASDRVPARRSRVFKIPLSGASIPASLKRIEIEVSAAGRILKQTFPAAPNQETTFEWDGLDAYGRQLQGTQPVQVSIAYVYDSVYAFPAPLPASFAVASSNPIPGSQGRQELRRGETKTYQSRGWDSRGQGLGGWTLDLHHAYDMVGRVLYLGDGSRRSVGEIRDGLMTYVAGGGRSTAASGDGGPATQAGLEPTDLAFGPDGSLYIADTTNNRIRRVDPKGIITTFAGDGQAGFAGDGGLATLASLNEPQGVALGSDGSLYIADYGNKRVRQVDQNGVIHTVAGNGQYTPYPYPIPEGGLATESPIGLPMGVAVAADGALYISSPGLLQRVGTDGVISTVMGDGNSNVCFGDGGPAKAAGGSPNGLAIGPDGNLYIADEKCSTVRRVGPDGIITAVAGKAGQSGDSGDGGPATQALLSSVRDIAFGRDGDLYIADVKFNCRIRRVGPEGLIATIAGAGGCGNNIIPPGGSPARQSVLVPQGVAVGPDDNLYIGRSYGYAGEGSGVVQVAPALPSLRVGDFAIASEDGSELFAFNDLGRHLRTVNTLTGAVLYQFSYSNTGLLAAITDGDGNVTRIEHDASGNPTAIVSPYSQRTTLTVDGNGYLASMTNPAGETHQMEYSSEGFLSRFTDPRRNVSTMAFDSLGRLTKDSDPQGGSHSLVRSDFANGYEVSRKTALNRVTTYRVEDLTTGDGRRLVTAPDGTQAEHLSGANASEKTTLSDGSITDRLLSVDPRFSLQAPLTKNLSLATGGLTSTLTVERTATLADANNPLSLQTLRDSLTLNGRPFASLYEAGTRTFTDTSAANRVSQTIIDGFGRATKFTLGNLFATDYTYDNRGRLSTVSQGTGADQRLAVLGYNGAGYLDSVTDPLTRLTRFEYDLAGRITRQVFPDSRPVLFDYDANGNLTSVTPPGRPAHEFTYTPVNLISEYLAPQVGTENNRTVYRYNADRQLTEIDRPDDKTLGYFYDTAGRLNRLSIPEGDYTLGYDSTTGKLAQVTAPDSASLAFTYNGALLTKTVTTGAVPGEVGYAYDNDFRITGVSVIGGNSIGYQYDADSLLMKAGDLNLTRSTATGLLTGSTMGVINDALSYNGFGEVTRYEAKVSGSAPPLFAVDYTYDPLGRITRKVESFGVVSNTYDYGYDLGGRLAEVKRNNATVSTYSYDDNGNREIHSQGGTSITGTYDAQDRLLTYGVNTYSYSANGELKTKTVGSQATTYDYDVLGNLRKVELPGTTIEYVIDAANRRVGKKINGTLVQGFLYQSHLKPIAELDGQGNVVSRFVYATHVNVPDYMIKGGVTYRIITDHLGSPRFVVNVANGSIAQQMDYDEFGNVIGDTSTGFQPFGFAGGLYDRDTKLVRFGARDYDAETGRWTAKEESFPRNGINPYVYVDNEPVGLTDPLGYSGEKSNRDSYGSNLSGPKASVKSGNILGKVGGGGTEIGISDGPVQATINPETGEISASLGAGVKRGNAEAQAKLEAKVNMPPDACLTRFATIEFWLKFVAKLGVGSSGSEFAAEVGAQTSLGAYEVGVKKNLGADDYDRRVRVYNKAVSHPTDIEMEQAIKVRP